ncbi:MAG: sulfite exporter TauE/SafE family protein [Anaerolineales bacterium]
MIILELLIVGTLIGSFSALLGLGGGILMVPALTLIFHLPIRTAVGTSLVGIIAASAGSAFMEKKDREGDFRLALRLEVATTAGAVLGSVLAGYVSEKMIEITFAFVALFTAIYMIYKSSRPKHLSIPDDTGDQNAVESLFYQNYQPRHWLAGLSMASVTGAISGLLGVSGGFIKVPVMYSIMEVPLGIATTTSSIMVGITAAASVFIYYMRGDIHPLVAIPISIGVFSGALVGNFLLPHARVTWLRAGLVGLLMLMCGQMIMKAAGA